MKTNVKFQVSINPFFILLFYGIITLLPVKMYAQNLMNIPAAMNIEEYFDTNFHNPVSSAAEMGSPVDFISANGFTAQSLTETESLNFQHLRRSNDLFINSELMEFNTQGLYYAEFFDYIFRGHFENIEIKQDEIEFLMIFESYLNSYGSRCSNYLPENKTPILITECKTETVTRNGYGMETNRYCSEWRTKESGLFAKPDLYEAKLQIDNIQNANAMGTAISMMTDPNAVGNSVDLVHKSRGLKNDMARIFQLNPCDSPGIKRFEENLRLFALGEPSIRMDEVSKYAAMKSSGGPTGPQDFNKLVDELVINQSKTWSFNRYIPGSISDLAILSKDNDGRPTDLKAYYFYSGFNGKSKGWVRVTFSNGLPKCIYFFDYPNNCKNPSSSIVASYAKGDYIRN